MLVEIWSCGSGAVPNRADQYHAMINHQNINSQVPLLLPINSWKCLGNVVHINSDKKLSKIMEECSQPDSHCTAAVKLGLYWTGEAEIDFILVAAEPCHLPPWAEELPAYWRVVSLRAGQCKGLGGIIGSMIDTA